MFDLSSINVAKSEAKKNYEKINQDLEKDLNTGISYLKEFAKNHSVQTLRKAMDQFFLYIENKKTKPEPFFYISYSAYLLNDKKLAEKYLNYTRQVAPDFQYLNELKLLINKM